MSRFCHNRPEGFGPHSELHPSLPTTCFLDVIVEPLATWIFIAVMIALLPLRVKAWRNNNITSRASDTSSSPTKAHHRKHKLLNFTNRQPHDGVLRHPPSKLSRVFSGIYYVLIVALIAMLSLELARLVAAELGIGLLPFTYVGIVMAVLNRVTWRAKVARLANVSFWILLVVAVAFKVAAEQREQEDSSVRRTKDVTTQGNYPSSDEVLDNAVMLGVQVVLAALEFNSWKGLQ